MQKNSEWNGIRRILAEYCRENNILETDFRLLGINEWENVYSRFLSRFVEERYARRCGLHWSNTENGFRKDINKIYIFREGAEGYASYEWIEKLPEITDCLAVYLFLEDERSKYWAAECSPMAVSLVINDVLYPADYYITDKKFRWVITENHHNVVQFLGNGLDLQRIRAACERL